MKIDRAGYPFIAGALVPAAGLAAARRYGWGTGFAALGGFLAYFFRDPERQVPTEPGPGRVAGRRPRDDRRAEPTAAGRRPATGCRSRSSCRRWTSTSTARRWPAASRASSTGRARSCRPIDESVERERAERDLDRHDGRTIVFRQVVGMLARRIVCRVREGQSSARGERIGLMKFGSRMDVFLPTDAAAPRRASARRVVGGETVLARLPGAGRCSVTCRCAGARIAAPVPPRRLPAAVAVHRRQPVLRLRLRRLRDARRLRHGGAASSAIAMVLDTLDGFFARLTNSSTRVRRRARLAGRRRVVRPGAGDPRVHVGTVAARAPRVGGRLHLRHRRGDAAGAVQHPDDDRRPTSAISSACRAPPPAAVIASTVYLFPCGLQDPRAAAAGAGDGARARVPDGQHHPLPQHQGDRHGLAALVPRALPRRRRARAHRLAPAARARRHVLHLRHLRVS